METKRFNFWLAASLGSLLLLFSYLNQLIYQYQVPAGGDAINHEAIVRQLLNGNYSVLVTYHTAWHIIVAAIVILTHARIITVMAWLAPMLLVTMGLSLFYFGKRYFGLIAGITSLIVIGFMSYQPLQTLYDGGFPNVLAAGTVLPFTFIALENLYSSRRKLLAILWFIGMLILLAFAHHLTTLYGVTIIAVFLIVMLASWLKTRNVSWTLIFLSIIGAFLMGTIALAIFINAPITGSVHGLLDQFVQANWSWPFIHLIGHLDNPNAIWPINVYPQAIGPAVVYLGIAGLIVAMGIVLFQTKIPRWRAAMILIVWTVVLAIGSQIKDIGFPVRLARDLAIPLALLAGLLIQVLSDFFTAHRVHKIIFVPLLVAAVIIPGWPTLTGRFHQAIEPNTLVNFLPVDANAAQYMTQNLPADTRIVTFQKDAFFGDFLSRQKVFHVTDQATVNKFIHPANLTHKDLAGSDYVYVQWDKNVLGDVTDNYAIVTSYSTNSNFKLLSAFTGDDKVVYVFRSLFKPEPKT